MPGARGFLVLSQALDGPERYGVLAVLGDDKSAMTPNRKWSAALRPNRIFLGISLRPASAKRIDAPNSGAPPPLGGAYRT
jgi:hypothetical protein